MSSDNRFQSDPVTGGTQPDSNNADRSPRSLGRGLEDVSHLFSSAMRETSGHVQVGDRALERPGVRPACRVGVGVLRPSVSPVKDQLTATLVEYPDALENGMCALGAAVSCSPYGEIDILAVDRFNQFTVVDVETTAGDELLRLASRPRRVPELPRRPQAPRHHVEHGAEPLLVALERRRRRVARLLHPCCVPDAASLRAGPVFASLPPPQASELQNRPPGSPRVDDLVKVHTWDTR